MPGSLFLQIFLFINVFLIGAMATIVIQHAYAHFRPKQPEKKPRAQDQDGHLPPEVRQKLLLASQANFQAVLERSATELRRDLQSTTVQLNKILQKLGTEVVGNEMERYRIQLEQIRKQADKDIGGAQDEIAKHQADLKAKLDEQHAAQQTKLAEELAAEKQRLVQEILAEKQQLMQQIDTKLADAVASFLIDTLGHDVDLGAQNAYLTAMLEEHKDDFKRELKHEA